MKGVVVCVVMLMGVACTAAPAVDTSVRAHRSHTPTPVASKTMKTQSEPVTVLVYVRKGSVRGFDVKTGRDIGLRAVPGPDVVLSPDGDRVAFVIDLAPGTDPEGFGEPQITVADIEGDEEIVLGPGRSPRWSPDGHQIAAITDDGVAFYEVATTTRTTVLKGDDWSVLGWSGDRVVAVGPGGAVLAAPDREPAGLGLPPAWVWGVSPVDDTVISVEGEHPRVVNDDSSIVLDIEGTLGDGAWAPDGSSVAVVLVGGRSRLITLDPASGAVRYPEEGLEAQGNVVWSGDSQTFAFVRVNPDDRLELQAVVCSRELTCEPTFSWAQGVMLLGFTTRSTTVP